MRHVRAFVVGVVLVVACGGGTTTIGDGGIDGAGGQAGSGGQGGTAGHGGSGGHGGAGGSAGSGGAAGSGGTSGSGTGGGGGHSGDGGIQGDAATCTPPDTTCATPCPKGTYCLKASGPLETDLGCTTIPPECSGGKATCACMGFCFCSGSSIDMCVEGTDYLECNNGAISRREFKRDIAYVTSDERAELAHEALSTSLARYHYKGEPDGRKKHLGFIIDDQPGSSPAVASDETHVDEYGYTSMLLAAVQEQQKRIDALERELAEMRMCQGR